MPQDGNDKQGSVAHRMRSIRIKEEEKEEEEEERRRRAHSIIRASYRERFLHEGYGPNGILTLYRMAIRQAMFVNIGNLET